MGRGGMITRVTNLSQFASCVPGDPLVPGRLRHLVTLIQAVSLFTAPLPWKPSSLLSTRRARHELDLWKHPLRVGRGAGATLGRRQSSFRTEELFVTASLGGRLVPTYCCDSAKRNLTGEAYALSEIEARAMAALGIMNCLVKMNLCHP